MYHTGWDQADTSVKIYVTLPGVETLPQEKISVNFGSKSGSKLHVDAVNVLIGTVKLHLCAGRLT